jgi:hypothetical protein
MQDSLGDGDMSQRVWPDYSGQTAPAPAGAWPTRNMLSAAEA